MRTNTIKNRLNANIIGYERKKVNPSPPTEENVTESSIGKDEKVILPETKKSYWNF